MSGTTISFDEISYDIRRPQTIIEVKPDYTTAGLGAFPAKAIMVGQTDGGTALAATCYPILRRGQAEVLFGARSMLTDMCNSFLDNNTTIPLFAIGAPPPTGAVAATATWTFQSVAAGTGTVPYTLCGRSVPLIVRQGDTASVQAAAFAAVVNADALMPVSAAAAGAVVTLTARSPGAQGNAYRYKAGGGWEARFVAGVATVVTPFASGAGVPDVTPLLAAIATDWFTDLAIGWGDSTNLAVLTPELERRFGANGRLDMHAYYAELFTTGQALADGPSQNSRFMSRIAALSQSAPWRWAAALAGVASFQLTNDPARQLKSLPLVGILAPERPDRPLDTDDENLLRAGYSTFNVLSDGTVTLQRVITCYQTSPQGIPDTAWLDIMRPKTMTRIRWDWASYLGLQWPRAKLTDDNSIAATYDPDIATPRRLQNSWAARSGLYERQGWIEGSATTAAMSVFVRDATDRNRVDARQFVNQVGNLMVFAARLEFEV